MVIVNKVLSERGVKSDTELKASDAVMAGQKSDISDMEYKI